MARTSREDFEIEYNGWDLDDLNDAEDIILGAIADAIKDSAWECVDEFKEELDVIKEVKSKQK